MTVPGRIEACKSCGADIRWSRTSTHRMMPFDAQPNQIGEWRLVTRAGTWLPLAEHVPKDLRPAFAHELLIAHWDTCPYAHEHKRRPS